MKSTDIVIEKIHSKVASKWDPTKEVLIFKNPSNLEMMSIKGKTINGELRGLLVGGAVYIWDADLALHDDISSELALDANSKFIIDIDAEYINADNVDNDVSGHPMMKRMLRTR